MKIFVVMLLLANIACWTWQMNFSSPERANPPAVREEAPFLQARNKLTMLSEMPTLPRTEPPAEVVTLDVASSEPEALSEAVPDQSVLEPADAQPLAAPIESPILEPWCAVTNALSQVTEAEKLLAEWEKVGGVGEIASEKEPVSSTWWVHLPRFPDEAAARVILNELQGKKIDSYYMRTGDLAGGISLGVFSREESARKVQAELRGKGYATEVSEIERMEERSRLYLILENGDPKNNESVSQVLAKFEAIHPDEIPCK